MGEMVERVAKAIARAEYGDGYDRPWEPFIAHARAAIEAMREPTEAMKDAADAYLDAEYNPIDRPNVRQSEIWQSMIDEALR